MKIKFQGCAVPLRRASEIQAQVGSLEYEVNQLRSQIKNVRGVRSAESESFKEHRDKSATFLWQVAQVIPALKPLIYVNSDRPGRAFFRTDRVKLLADARAAEVDSIKLDKLYAKMEKAS